MAKLPQGRIADMPVSDPMPPRPKGPGGRPTTYSEAIAEQICDYIADGGTLRGFCEQPNAPARSSILLWLSKHSEFSARYTRAREEQAHSLVETLLERSRQATSETAAGDRVAIDAMKWVASKVLARVYGDKAQVDMQTLDAEGKPAAPAPFVVQFVSAKDGKPE